MSAVLSNVTPMQMCLCACAFFCSCSETPWRVCSVHNLSHGRVVPVGGADSGPSLTTVVEAVAQLELPDAHPQECLDALKQLLCLSHFSPCEGGNQTAPGRPACGPDCRELFTGRCQDTWEAYLSYVIQDSGAYKDHIERCAEEGNDHDCALLFTTSKTPLGTATPSETLPTTAPGKYAIVQCMCQCVCPFQMSWQNFVVN